MVEWPASSLGRIDLVTQLCQVNSGPWKSRLAKLLDISMRRPVHLTMERGSIVETRLADAPLEAVPTLCEHARDAVAACEQ